MRAQVAPIFSTAGILGGSGVALHREKERILSPATFYMHECDVVP